MAQPKRAGHALMKRETNEHAFHCDWTKNLDFLWFPLE
jgi:hypothetical protein